MVVAVFDRALYPLVVQRVSFGEPDWPAANRPDFPRPTHDPAGELQVRTAWTGLGRVDHFLQASCPAIRSSLVARRSVSRSRSKVSWEETLRYFTRQHTTGTTEASP